MKKHELPLGTRLVPGKGVFTVKPDGNGYRRKTRLVACGNYLPADEIDDLYAAGADATTLRAILAYAAGKPWAAGSTDIRQAFVLAPGKGKSVATMPPKLAIDMGLRESDEVWLSFFWWVLFGRRSFQRCRSTGPGTYTLQATLQYFASNCLSILSLSSASTTTSGLPSSEPTTSVAPPLR